MPKEIEQGYAVAIEKMPDLSRYPSVEIAQTYFTPDIHNPKYPETRLSEWRIRKTVSEQGTSWSSAIKIGDKKSGKREEIETEIEPGSFGAGDEARAFAFARLIKRRWDLGGGLVVDRFIDAKPGDEYQAEKEFASEEERGAWSPPEWLVERRVPSSRERAKRLFPSLADGLRTQAQVPELVYKELIEQKNPLIVAISGMSGSGKSTIAQQIMQKLEASYIDTDRLHIGKTKLMEIHGSLNHDVVAAYDYELAARAAVQLALGSPVDLPHYDYLTIERTGSMITHFPTEKGAVVIDGLYASESLKYISDELGVSKFSVLVDTPLYVSLIRRMLRDSGMAGPAREVPFTPAGSLKYLLEKAIPTYLKAEYHDSFNMIIR